MTSENIIYALVDPRDGQIRYVGKSSCGLARPRAHASRAGTEHSYKASWIRQMLKAGRIYQIQILEEVPLVEDLNASEIKWIKTFRLAGMPLTNLTGGGDGLSNCLDETRAKISVARRGTKASEETRAKMRESAKYRPPQSDGTKAKRSATLKGRPGPKPSAETREKMRKAHTGRKHSAETIARMCVAQQIRRGKERGV